MDARTDSLKLVWVESEEGYLTWEVEDWDSLLVGEEMLVFNDSCGCDSDVETEYSSTGGIQVLFASFSILKKGSRYNWLVFWTEEKGGYIIIQLSI